MPENAPTSGDLVARSRSARARALALSLGVALALLAGAARAQTTIVAFGDSITEGIGDDPDRAEKGYPPRLEDLLQAAGTNANVVNMGIEGETTAEGLSRIDAVLTAVQPDTLLLMEGTNDIPLVSNETIVFNLDQIARRAEQRGVETVHATLFPRRNTAGLDANNDLTSQVSALIRELAWKNDRRLADPFEVFFPLPQLYNLYYPPNDKFHPNAAGYDLMAQTFFHVLSDVDEVPPVVGRLSPPNRSEGVSPGTSITVDVYDFGAGINLAKTSLRVDGQPVEATARGDNRRLQLSFDPPSPLRGVVDVELVSEDLASPVNTVDRRISRFVIAGTTFLNGDTDRDGRVDGADLVRLAVAFGSAKGDPRFLASADLNSDNLVDGLDLALLASNFGKSSG